jgi:hypothetical protein
MIEPKSIEKIASIINAKINMMLIEQLPTPSCPLKKQHNEWKKEEVKKSLTSLLKGKNDI